MVFLAGPATASVSGMGGGSQTLARNGLIDDRICAWVWAVSSAVEKGIARLTRLIERRMSGFDRRDGCHQGLHRGIVDRRIRRLELGNHDSVVRHHGYVLDDLGHLEEAVRTGKSEVVAIGRLRNSIQAVNGLDECCNVILLILCNTADVGVEVGGDGASDCLACLRVLEVSLGETSHALLKEGRLQIFHAKREVHYVDVVDCLRVAPPPTCIAARNQPGANSTYSCLYSPCQSPVSTPTCTWPLQPALWRMSPEYRAMPTQETCRSAGSDRRSAWLPR